MFDAVRDAGLLRIAVPTELGRDGATIRQVAMVQRELAAHCGSTALASAMHQHVTAFTAWRYRRNLPGAETTLRRIAETVRPRPVQRQAIGMDDAMNPGRRMDSDTRTQAVTT